MKLQLKTEAKCLASFSFSVFFFFSNNRVFYLQIAANSCTLEYKILAIGKYLCTFF